MRKARSPTGKTNPDVRAAKKEASIAIKHATPKIGQKVFSSTDGNSRRVQDSVHFFPIQPTGPPAGVLASGDRQ